jgi:hypothetical protein
MRPREKMHEILILAYTNSQGNAFLQVRCACGTFLLDRESPAEASLPEITRLVGMHYMQTANPEKSNGTTSGRKKRLA